MRRCYLFTIVVVSALACAGPLQAQQAAAVGSGVPESRTGVRARGPGGLVSFKSNGSTYRLGDVEYERAPGCAVSVSGNGNALIATDVRIRDTGEDAVRVEGNNNAVVVSGAEIVRSGGFGINADGDDNVVTIIHGQVSGLRVGGSSIANLMGGPLDGKLVVGSKGTVLVYGTGLRLTGTRLEGALTDGTKVNLEVEKQEGARILLQNAAITPPMSAKTETRARPEPREPKETPRSKNAEIPEQTAALVKEIAELRTTVGQLEKQLFAGKVRNATEEQSQGKPQGLPEDLAKRRSRMILDDPDEMVDATRWGEDIPNPFAKITPEGQAKLTARGIDVKKLQAIKAVKISGEHMGASSKTFVNLNPEIVVVLAKGFDTHNWVYSAGPILVESGGRDPIMGRVIGAQLVWFVGGSAPMGGAVGKPIIVAPTMDHGRWGDASGDIWFGDYGLGGIDESEVVPPVRRPRPERLEPGIGKDDPAAAAIEKLGGKIEYDKKSPARPVETVNLSEAGVTDADLVHLKGLTSLRALFLYDTRITDAGLKNIEGLTSLQSLGLSNTRVTNVGLEHLKGLVHLQSLYLRSTQVTGAGLEHLKGLASLQRLNLTDTRITDAGLQHLKGMSSLQQLDLDDTEVTNAGLEHLKGLTSLQVLDLNETRVNDAGVSELKKALPKCAIRHVIEKLGLRDQAVAATEKAGPGNPGPTVEQDQAVAAIQERGARVEYDESKPERPILLVHFSRATDDSLAHLKGLAALRALYLSNTQVTDAGLEHIAGLTSLRTLSLSDTRVTGAGLEHLKGLAYLQELRLARTRVTDAGLEQLKGLTNLQSLDLDGTQVTDAGLEELKKLTNLQSLDLSHTTVTDAGLEHSKEMARLRTLYLISTQISDAGLEHLNGVTGLHALRLDGTRITNAGLKHLKGLTNLQALSLRKTQVTDAGLVNLRGMTNLQYLDLSETQVTNAGLESLKQIATLETLMLHLTQVTHTGVDGLRKTLPRCTVMHTPRPRPPFPGPEVGRNDAIAAIEKLGGKIRYDEQLATRPIVLVDLAGTKATDAHLLHLKGLSDLQQANLSSTRVTDAGLEYLQGLTKLQRLDLRETQVTDAGLKWLQRMASLEWVDLSATHVTDTGANDFREALPRCTVLRAQKSQPTPR